MKTLRLSPERPSMQLLRLHETGTVPLAFTCRQVASGQPRVNGKYVFEPELTHPFRFNAVVDFAEFLVSYRAERSYRMVRTWFERADVGHSVYVKGPKEQLNHWGRNFLVRIQEPDLQKLKDVVRAALLKHHDLAGDIAFHEIEVSADAYPRPPSGDECQRMLAAMVLTYLPAASMIAGPMDRLRCYQPAPSGKGRRSQHPLDPNTVEPDSKVEPQDRAWSTFEPNPAIRLDQTFYAGAQKAEARVRLMVKTSDRKRPGSNERLELPPHKHRARIEVTLKGTALAEAGFTALHTVKPEAFRSLRRRYFDFRLPAFDAEEVAAFGLERRWDHADYQDLATFMLCGVSAYDRDVRHRELWERRLVGGKHSIVPKHIAYAWMNERIRKALDGLGRKIGLKGVSPSSSY